MRQSLNTLGCHLDELFEQDLSYTPLGNIFKKSYLWHACLRIKAQPKNLRNRAFLKTWKCKSLQIWTGFQPRALDKQHICTKPKQSFQGWRSQPRTVCPALNLYCNVELAYADVPRKIEIHLVFISIRNLSLGISSLHILKSPSVSAFRTYWIWIASRLLFKPDLEKVP